MVDPKIYEFKFFVDDVEYTSDNYEVNEAQTANILDLSNAKTKIYIRKNKQKT